MWTMLLTLPRGGEGTWAVRTGSSMVMETPERCWLMERRVRVSLSVTKGRDEGKLGLKKQELNFPAPACHSTPAASPCPSPRTFLNFVLHGWWQHDCLYGDGGRRLGRLFLVRLLLLFLLLSLAVLLAFSRHHLGEREKTSCLFQERETREGFHQKQQRRLQCAQWGCQKNMWTGLARAMGLESDLAQLHLICKHLRGDSKAGYTSRLVLN